MNQLLTGNIWAQVNALLDDSQQKIVCVAYVTAENLSLTHDDVLICDASDFSIKQGNTKAETLNGYFQKGVKIYNNRNLHSKLLLTSSFLVVGSSNLSHNSAVNLIESAILSYSKILISQAKAFCHNLIKESKLLTEEEIEDLLKIEVIKRPQKKFSTSVTKNIHFGNSCWVLPTEDLSERLINADRPSVEKSKKKIAKKKNILEDSIGYIRLTGSTKFIKTAKEGDQIIQNWRNKKRSRRIIFQPVTILEIERLNGVTYFYYDSDPDKALSWTRFKSKIKDLELEKGFDKMRTRQVSSKDIDKLLAVWE